MLMKPISCGLQKFQVANVWLLTFIAFGFRIEGIILEEIS